MAEISKSGEKVKYRLAEAMKECMKKAPVEKITVKEITEECGVTRQTFYRNFQDKYDLINWYFDKILIESFHQMGEGSTVYESLVKKFEYIRMEHLFFKAAFKNDEHLIYVLATVAQARNLVLATQLALALEPLVLLLG